LHPQLDKLHQQFSRASGLARDLVAGVAPEQLILRVDSDCWSIAECLVHLNVSSEAAITKIEKACAEGREQRLLGVGPFRKDLRGALLRWFIMPPPRIRVRTSEKLEPSATGPVEKILPRFLTLQNELQELVMGAEGLDLNKVMVTSPVAGCVRYNLFSCFEIILAHQLRHFWQAEHIKKALGVYNRPVINKATN
jgi:DinB superfamily